MQETPVKVAAIIVIRSINYLSLKADFILPLCQLDRCQYKNVAAMHYSSIVSKVYNTFDSINQT